MKTRCVVGASVATLTLGLGACEAMVPALTQLGLSFGQDVMAAASVNYSPRYAREIETLLVAMAQQMTGVQFQAQLAAAGYTPPPPRYARQNSPNGYGQAQYGQDPNAPSPYGQSYNGYDPSQAQYGQTSNGYGQQYGQPQYGTASNEYGQQQYSQPTNAYGQPQYSPPPQYGQATNGYAQPQYPQQPQYSQATNGYGQPQYPQPPQYGQATNGYAQPQYPQQPQYSQATNGYGQPQYPQYTQQPQYGPVTNGDAQPQYGSDPNGGPQPQYGSAQPQGADVAANSSVQPYADNNSYQQTAGAPNGEPQVSVNADGPLQTPIASDQAPASQNTDGPADAATLPAEAPGVPESNGAISEADTTQSPGADAQPSDNPDQTPSGTAFIATRNVQPVRVTLDLLVQRAGAVRAAPLEVIDDGAVLHDGSGDPAAGDRLKVRFTASCACYLYVIGIDATGYVARIFPDAEAGLGNPVQANRQYLLPEQGTWWGLDAQRGIEQIHVVASYVERPDIEQALDQLSREARRPVAAYRSVAEVVEIPSTRGLVKVKETPTVATSGGTQTTVATAFHGSNEDIGIVATRWFHHE